MIDSWKNVSVQIAYDKLILVTKFTEYPWDLELNISTVGTLGETSDKFTIPAGMDIL